jgi:hypothetical protein
MKDRPTKETTDDAAYEAEARAEARRAYPGSAADQASFLTAALGRKPTTDCNCQQPGLGGDCDGSCAPYVGDDEMSDPRTTPTAGTNQTTAGESHEMAARWIMEELHKHGFEVVNNG